MTARFAYVWEFLVREDSIETFRRAYGPDGEWVQLFSRAEGYVRTDLFHDVTQPTRFLTIDLWTSRQARDAFREKFRSELDDLDGRCDALTVEERFVGDFSVAPPVELKGSSTADPR